MDNALLFRGMYLVHTQTAKKSKNLFNRKWRSHPLYKNRCELRTTENFPSSSNGLHVKFGCRLSLCFKLYLYTTYVCAVLSHFSHVQHLRPYGLQPARLFCPQDFQARILEWVVVLSSKVSFPSRDQICISNVSSVDRRVLYHQLQLGSPYQLHFLKNHVLIVYSATFR